MASAARGIAGSRRVNPLSSWTEEQRSAYLYRACAEAEAGTVRADLFTRLAGEAEAQGVIWRAQLTARGHPPPPPFVPDSRTLLVAWLVKLLGPRRMKAVLAAMKVRGMAVYGTSFGVESGHATPHRRRQYRIPPSQPRRWRQPARGRLWRQRWTRVERKPDPRRRRRQQRSAPDPCYRRGGTCRRRLRDGSRRNVSVRSQRELYEYQIGLERDELKQYPEAEAQELALIYAAKGLPQKEATKLAKQIVADPEHALDTLRARGTRASIPQSLAPPSARQQARSRRSPVAPRCRSRPSCSRRGRARCCSAWWSRASPSSASVRRCRSSPAAARGTPARACCCSARSQARSPSGSGASSVSRLADRGAGRAGASRRVRLPRSALPAPVPVITLKPGREKSLAQRHPWIFSGAIERIDGDPGPGDTITVVAADGAWLALAAYSPASQIRARAWSFTAGEAIDEAFFARAVQRAVAARAPLLDADHTGARLVHGESDGLPGVIADRYGDVIVLQCLADGCGALAGRARRRTGHGHGDALRLRTLRRRSARAGGLAHAQRRTAWRAATQCEHPRGRA